MSFIKNKNPKINKEAVIEQSYDFAIKKFGRNGYAVEKMYVDDERYKKYLMDIQYMIDNKDKFKYLAEIMYEKLFD